MALFDPIRVGASSAGDYEIERSLRFQGNAKLSRTPSSDGNRTLITYSIWIKRSELGEMFLLDARRDDSNRTRFGIDAGNRMQMFQRNQGSDDNIILNAQLLDVASWYHLVWRVDTTQGTANNRIRFYINGVLQDSFASNSPPSQNEALFVNKDELHTIGCGQDSGGDEQFFKGYIADVNLIDGQSLGPTSFGKTDPSTGQWIPIEYTGTYGTNGFYLEFKDNSGNNANQIGKDTSGNGHNFTPDNITIGTTSAGDSFIDTPTNNFCTLNPRMGGSVGTITDGAVERSGGGKKASGTILMDSGKYYFEVGCHDSNGNHAIGVCQHDTDQRDRINSECAHYFANGEFKIENNSQQSGFSSYGNNDIIGVAYDSTQNPPKVWFAKNNSWQGASGNSGTFDASGGYSLTSNYKYLFSYDHGSNSSSSSGTCRFGASQLGFTYTPPTGFKALNTQNLPTPAIKDGKKHFDAVIYTGNSGNLTVTGFDFQPDFLWLKSRNQGYRHYLFDAVRGTGQKALSSNLSVAEGNDAGNLGSFNSNGFSTNGASGFNDNGSGTDGFIAWGWNAGGSTVTNNDGTISTQVRASTTAGISIVTYTGDGNTNASIGHGLGAKPHGIFLKNRSRDSTDWLVMNHKIPSHDGGNYANNSISLNQESGLRNILGVWAAGNSTTQPISDGQLSSGNRDLINRSGDNYVAYFFTSIPGYSAHGYYFGNGNSDGPYVYLGFRPQFLIIKLLTGNNWAMYDEDRDPFNGMDERLHPNRDQTTNTGAGLVLDFHSNGFKVRTSDDLENTNGNRHIYFAFARNPFKHANPR